MSRRSRYSGYEPIIIVGTGIAGLLLAIELAENGQRSIVITKDKLEQSNTAWAQGGLAAVTGQNALDCADCHFLDTVAAGDGLTDHQVVREIISGGNDLVRRLLELGVKFDLSSLALEGGHSLARVVHSADATGRSIVAALVQRARSSSKITMLEGSFLREIVVENGYACGVIVDVHDVHNEANDAVQVKRIDGKAVVLATGGLGQVYARTTNPLTATGDGIATAYRAGACLADMEFVQFHPTALHLEGAPAFLISEAVRGAGAVLLDKNGQRFAQRYNHAGELATRDKVSRAIFWNMLEEGTDCVWLDMSMIGKEAIEEKFPNIVSRLRSYGIEPTKDPVPVSPAAHYFMGGILADEFGRTTLSGLYAIGECASTGLHGANRLASNSLLEGGVMALKLSRHILGKDKRWIAADRLVLPCRATGARSAPLQSFERPLSFDLRSELDLPEYKKNLMLSAGLIRNENVLNEFLNQYDHQVQNNNQTNQTPADQEAKNIFALGRLIAYSALQRRESRGAHWRTDHPQRDDAKFRARLVLHRDGQLWIPVREVEPAITASIASANALAAGS